MYKVIIYHIHIFIYTALGRENLRKINKVEEKLSQQDLLCNNTPEEVMSTKFLEILNMSFFPNQQVCTGEKICAGKELEYLMSSPISGLWRSWGTERGTEMLTMLSISLLSVQREETAGELLEQLMQSPKADHCNQPVTLERDVDKNGSS